MFNLYIDEKKKINISKKLNEEKNNISEIQKHKKLLDNLCTNYQKRIKQFIIDVSFI
jgi:hypothetical protein